MQRFLICGDPHATRLDLPECRNLIDFIIKTAQENNISDIIILGDLFDKFSVIDSYVLHFWNESFNKMCGQGFQVYILRGNHDSPSAGLDNAPEHVLSVFKDRMPSLKIIDNTKTVNGIQFISHFYDHSLFLSKVDLSAQSIYCHADINGVQYENGFYSKYGIDPDKLPKSVKIISGHVHKNQEWDNIWYPGSPRWRSISDSNEPKGIWIVEHEDDGAFLSKTFISTESVCTPFYSFVLNPDSELQSFPNKGVIHIDLHGPRDWIEFKQKEFDGKGYKIRSFPESKEIKIRESDGMIKAFDNYFDEFIPKYGTDKNELKELVEERVKWQ